MLAPLTAALARLDYPAAKLDIKLILEAVDVETIAVARRLTLPGNVEVVVVPDLHPRTKPKALNYVLPLARGEYLVIFDAEDRRQSATSCAKPSPRSRRGLPILPASRRSSISTRHRQLAHTPIHHRIRRAVRRAVAGTRPLGASQSRLVGPQIISAYWRSNG
jgi:hypothetical protein